MTGLDVIYGGSGLVAVVLSSVEAIYIYYDMMDEMMIVDGISRDGYPVTPLHSSFVSQPVSHPSDLIIPSKLFLFPSSL